jgi:hypothetical protein
VRCIRNFLSRHAWNGTIRLHYGLCKRSSTAQRRGIQAGQPTRGNQGANDVGGPVGARSMPGKPNGGLLGQGQASVQKVSASYTKGCFALWRFRCAKLKAGVVRKSLRVPRTGICCRQKDYGRKLRFTDVRKDCGGPQSDRKVFGNGSCDQGTITKFGGDVCGGVPWSPIEIT